MANEADGRTDVGLLGSQPTSQGLDDLISGVRDAVNTRADWKETAGLVAGELRRHLPSPEVVLTPEQRVGDPVTHQSHVLYVEPGGAFSIVGLVWRPGQMTPIHDHVTWCVFGVLQGIEFEEIFTLDESGEYLVEAGDNSNHSGDISGFAPPGDIHRVRNVGDGTAISLHIYGTDVSRIGSSVRRYYELPIKSS